MPRRDRAYGSYHQPGTRRGTSKRTRVIRTGKGKRNTPPEKKGA